MAKTPFFLEEEGYWVRELGVTEGSHVSTQVFTVIFESPFNPKFESLIRILNDQYLAIF